MGQHSHGIPEGGLGNDPKERVVIAMLVKDLGTGITPIQDMVAETPAAAREAVAWGGLDVSSDRGRG